MYLYEKRVQDKLHEKIPKYLNIYTDSSVGVFVRQFYLKLHWTK